MIEFVEIEWATKVSCIAFVFLFLGSAEFEATNSILPKLIPKEVLLSISDRTNCSGSYQPKLFIVQVLPPHISL